MESEGAFEAEAVALEEVHCVNPLNMDLQAYSPVKELIEDWLAP